MLFASRNKLKRAAQIVITVCAVLFHYPEHNRKDIPGSGKELRR